MNLTSDTVAILKNFSDINQNILVKPGNKIQTISSLKNILAEAEITEKFDQEFAIYDLPEFLRAIDLFDKSDLNFNGGQNLVSKTTIQNNQLNISLQINRLWLHQQNQLICLISLLHLHCLKTILLNL